MLPECCIQNLSFLEVRKRNSESVVFKLGNVHPSELLLRLGELPKIGDITKNIYNYIKTTALNISKKAHMLNIDHSQF